MTRTARIIVTVAAFAATIATGWHTAANAQERDDFAYWVTVGECSLDVVPSGAPLEVTVDGRGPVTIEAPQTIHVDGPATVIVGHRTPKQYEERIYEVPACPDTTTTTTTTTIPGPPSTIPETTTTIPSTTTTVPAVTTTSIAPTTTVGPPTTTSSPPSTTDPTPTDSVPPTTNTPTGDDSSTGDEPILPVTGPSDVLLALGVLGALMVIGGGTLLLSRAGKE